MSVVNFKTSINFAHFNLSIGIIGQTKVIKYKAFAFEEQHALVLNLTKFWHFVLFVIIGFIVHEDIFCLVM